MNSDTSPDIPRNKAIWILILIIVMAAGLRLWVISHTSLPAGDGAGSNMELAVNLLDGRGWESDRKWTYFGPWGDWGPIPHPEGNQQPLTSVLVAGAILIGGVDYRSGQAVVLLLSLASLVLLYLWASKRFNRTVALMAAALGAISSSQIWFGANLDTQAASQLTTLVFLFAALCWLPHSPKHKVKIRQAFGLGILAGVAYLTRVNGVLLLAGFWLWLLFWNRKGEQTKNNLLVRFLKHLRFIAPALVFSFVGFFILAAPWLWRNWQAFGSPFYSQNTYFIYTTNFWGAWSIRSAPPSINEFLSEYSFSGLILREVRGIYAAFESFILGNLHRNEVYPEGPLVIFVLMGFFWLIRRGEGRRDGLPLLIILLHIFALAAHQHTFRYMLPFYLLTFAYGTAGLQQTWQDPSNSIRNRFKGRTIKWLGILVALVVLSPMVRPLFIVLRFNDQQKSKEVYDAAAYISEHTQPQQVVADFPGLDTLIWKYRRPTILVPFDSSENIQAVFASYKPVYFVVTPETIKLRQGLTVWLGVNEKMQIVDKNLPANWHRVQTSESGRMVIYKLEW